MRPVYALTAKEIIWLPDEFVSHGPILKRETDPSY